MKKYLANRLRFGVAVAKWDTRTGKGAFLAPRHDLANYAPVFDWGNTSPGGAQLALAILADYLEDDAAAVALQRAFQRAVVAHLKFEDWLLTGDQIAAALRLIEADQREETELARDDQPARELVAAR